MIIVALNLHSIYYAYLLFISINCKMYSCSLHTKVIDLHTLFTTDKKSTSYQAWHYLKRPLLFSAAAFPISWPNFFFFGHSPLSARENRIHKQCSNVSHDKHLECYSTCYFYLSDVQVAFYVWHKPLLLKYYCKTSFSRRSNNSIVHRAAYLSHSDCRSYA